MNLTLKIWRQKGANDKGKIVDYPMTRRYICKNLIHL